MHWLSEDCSTTCASTRRRPAAQMPTLIDRYSQASPLHQQTHRVPAAEAEAGDTAFRAGADHLVQQRGEHARPRTADGVTDGDAAAADVELVLGNAELRDVGEHLRRERFVDLPQVDVAGLELV